MKSLWQLGPKKLQVSMVIEIIDTIPLTPSSCKIYLLSIVMACNRRVHGAQTRQSHIYDHMPRVKKEIEESEAFFDLQILKNIQGKFSRLKPGLARSMILSLLRLCKARCKTRSMMLASPAQGRLSMPKQCLYIKKLKLC